jgi:hypothetical protein
VQLRSGWWQLALLVLALFVLPAHAQYRASLQGTVADSTGALIPGAQLTLTDRETNHALTTTSDGAGNFNFNELPPSTYKLEVARDGFKTKVLDGVHILAEQANALNVVMEIGGKAETVTVNAAESPIIDTETGNVSGTIDQNDIAKMPSFGRDVFQLVQLAPGMFGDGAQGGGGGTAGLPGSNSGGSGSTDGVFKTENQPQSSGNGGRTNTNGISLDGVAITSVTWGGAAVVTPNEDSIKEVKVVANDYDAEYGRVSGAQIQVISQNGTNQYHGSGFFKIDRPGLNAKQRWDPNNNPQKDTSRFNQWGGSAGGPILHNKIFAFFAYETIRNFSTSTGGGWYDTASFDGSSSSGSIANKFLTLKGAGAVYSKVLEGAGDHHQCADVNLQQGVNCNWIQGQGLDLGRPLNASFPLGTKDPSYNGKVGSTYYPGLGGDGTGSYSNMDGNADLFYVATVNPSQNINVQYNGRLDYQVTSKDLIAGSIYYVPVNNTSYNGPTRASNIFHHNALNYSTGVLWNHTFSGSMLNEARADMAGWKWNELGDNPQSPLGLPDAYISSSCNGPNGCFGSTEGSTNPASFGPSVGSIFDQWTLNFKDVVTKVYKSHNLKFGGQVTRLAYEDAPTWNAEPSYNFNNLWDFINDAPESESITADPRTGVPSWFRKDDRQNIYAFFAQDDWKLKPNLTVNLGLRWEYFQGMTEKKGNEPNVRLGTGANVLTGLKVVLGGTQVDAQKGNFGPQIGFAWSPAHYENRLVLRGGFGLGYDGLEEAITTNTRFNPPFEASGASLYAPDILYGVGSNPYAANSFPANPHVITTFNAANLPINGLATGITGLPTNLPTSYVYHYSFEGQYDLGHQWIATAGYQGSLGRHLPVQNNLNNEYATQILEGQVAFNPILNNIDWYEDTGTSSFNALLLEARHQFSHTFEADAQYRWAKSLDNGSQPYATPDYEFLPGYNWGPSDYDSRQMFKLFGLWSPVIFHGQNNMLEKVAGGWNVSGIFNFHSGFPWSQYFSGLGCNAFYQGSGGDCNTRPISYNGQASRSQSTDSFKTGASHFPNGGTAYFTAPAIVQGNPWSNAVAPVPTALPQAPGLGRNAFVGPRYSDVDMAMTKAFGLPNMKVLGENARFEIRANAYNLFNKLNLTGIDNNIYDSTFGRANGVLGSRTIEMEAHFKF